MRKHLYMVECIFCQLDKKYIKTSEWWWVKEGWDKRVAWLPRTELRYVLDHLQRALHLHQAVEWHAGLGQRRPARREQHLQERSSEHLFPVRCSSRARTKLVALLIERLLLKASPKHFFLKKQTNKLFFTCPPAKMTGEPEGLGL